MNDLIKTHKADLAVFSSKSTRHSLKLQKSGERLQDKFTFCSEKKEILPCPMSDCGHYNCMVVESSESVRETNAALRSVYELKLEEFRANRRTTKPRCPKYKSAKIGCFCYQMFCMARPDGGNCADCRSFCSSGDTSHIQVDSDGAKKCVGCQVCICSCCVIFDQHDHHAISLDQATELDRSVNSNVSPANLVDLFTNVVNDNLSNNTILARNLDPLSSKKSIQQNAASLTAIQIMGDQSIQYNVPLRNKLRKCYGEKSTVTTDGISINALRDRVKAEKKERGRHHIKPNPNNLPTSHQTCDRIYRNRLNQDVISISDSPNNPSSRPQDDYKSYSTPTDEVICLSPAPAVSSMNTPEMQKRVRKKLVRKSIVDKANLSDIESEKLRKVQKNLYTKDVTTIKAMEDAEEFVENSEEMLSYVLSITSPFKK